MKRYIFFFLLLLAACTTEQITKTPQKGGKVTPPPPPPKYATIYYEVYDWSECNGDWTARFNDGEFFLLVESSLRPKEKVILPLNFNGEMKREKRFLQTPIKHTSSGETLIINLLDDDNLDQKTVDVIKAAEKIGGMIIFKDSRILLFKNILEYATNKPWDKFLNEQILSFEGTEPCGSAKYFVPSKAIESVGEAKFIEIKDNGKLKMKIKIYYTENK